MIKKYLSKMLLITAVGLNLGSTNAQTSDAPMCLEVNGGYREYLGDLGSSLFFGKKPNYQGAGVNFGYYLYPWLDGVVNFSAGDLGFYSVVEPRPVPWKYAGFHANTADVTLGGRFKLPALSESMFSPYIHLGFGGYYVHTQIRNRSTALTEMGANLQGGFGLSIRLTPKWGLRYSWTANYTMNDIWDGENGQVDYTLVHKMYRTNDMYAYNALGITYSFGEGSGGKRLKDSDEDGVPNKFDLCKNTPEKYRNFVDSNGCNADTDMDTIYDADDDCPKEWGLRAFNGCPDTDKDGIQNKLDDCPTVAGLAEFKGCPDTDGDGIADKDDKCPGVAGLKEFQGCPDTDGDGTEDSKDKCPTKAGPVAGEGCPDTDGDGIYDNTDRCPDKPGVVALKGCPEMKQEVIAKMKRAAQGIFFETNKDVIKPESFKNLNDLVTILNDFPEASVEIQGHTDDVGADAANLTLSQSRANSVKKYLIEHGVSESRLTAIGYGETKPIADNKTNAGKALNRRVEFVLTY